MTTSLRKLPLFALSLGSLALIGCGDKSPGGGDDGMAADTGTDAGEGGDSAGDTGSTGASEDTGDTADTADTADSADTGGSGAVAGFPRGVAVASPTAVVGGDAVLPEGVTAATAWTSDYAWITEQIQAVLEGSTAIADVFSGNTFMALGVDAPCFGPRLAYENHPDGADMPNPMGGGPELPTGDLGLWLEVDDPELPGGTGHACAAAQLNARVSGSRDQTAGAFLLAAGMVAAADEAGLALPAAGDAAVELTSEMNAEGISDVSFTLATVEQPTEGTWVYRVEFNLSAGAQSFPVELTLTHHEGAEATTYEGTLAWRVHGDHTVFHGFNCNAEARTLAGSVAYERASETEIGVQMRAAVFCGADSGTFDSSGQVDASDRFDPGSNPTGWSENFSIFAATFDPTTVAGEYAYVWQAGANDSHARVFNIGINAHTPMDGEAYFGYGARVFESTGSVEGFICNWAGPGATHPHVLTDYAQRQFIELDVETGLFVQPEGGSDIRYAPTNACTYDGEGTFWYDRNLNTVHDETAEDMTVIEADLLAAGAGQSIPETIADRGYTVPAAPGGWPGTP